MLLPDAENLISELEEASKNEAYDLKMDIQTIFFVWLSLVTLVEWDELSNQVTADVEHLVLILTEHMFLKLPNNWESKKFVVFKMAEFISRKEGN